MAKPMRKVIRLVMWAIVAVLAYKASIWAYDAYQAGKLTPRQQEVFEADKHCQMDADTQQCFCLHRRTGENLRLPYSECKTRAMENR
jgi:hypothetical protein